MEDLHTLDILQIMGMETLVVLEEELLDILMEILEEVLLELLVKEIVVVVQVVSTILEAEAVLVA